MGHSMQNGNIDENPEVCNHSLSCKIYNRIYTQPLSQSLLHLYNIPLYIELLACNQQVHCLSWRDIASSHTVPCWKPDQVIVPRRQTYTASEQSIRNRNGTCRTPIGTICSARISAISSWFKMPLSDYLHCRSFSSMPFLLNSPHILWKADRIRIRSSNVFICSD